MLRGNSNEKLIYLQTVGSFKSDFMQRLKGAWIEVNGSVRTAQ
jgi:hypothetical protein